MHSDSRKGIVVRNADGEEIVIVQFPRLNVAVVGWIDSKLNAQAVKVAESS